jgi:type III secretory pathway component EscU
MISNDSSTDTVFYSPKSVLRLEKWIDQVIVIGILFKVLYSINSFSTIHQMLSFNYFPSLGLLHPIVILLTVLLWLLLVVFNCAITYFPLKALIIILKILMQMEINSRKAK